MAHFEALLGERLQSCSNSASVPTASILDACEVVALFFAAHWCRRSTSYAYRLAEACDALRKANRPFRAVLVSRDPDEASFCALLDAHPWLVGIPFNDDDNDDRRAALSRRFKVADIPAVVLLRRDGTVITRDGLELVLRTENFPFEPPTALELLRKAGLIGQGGEAAGAEALSGRHVALFFSSHRCAPCRRFTPALAKAYAALRAAGGTAPPVEVVFVSSDLNKKEMKQYFREMPWLAIPFEERETREALTRMFGAEVPPILALLAPDGRLVNRDARGAVEAGRPFPWLPLPVNDLDEVGDDLQRRTAVVALMERAEGSWERLDALLGALAAEQRDRLAAGELPADEDDTVLFFTAKDIGGGMSGQLRKRLGLGAPTHCEPLVAVTDLRKDRFRIFAGGNVTKDEVLAVLAAWGAGSMPS